MIKAAPLWQKTSALGGVYFVAEIGGGKILIFDDRDRNEANAPSHQLSFAEPTQPTQPQAKPRSVPGERRQAANGRLPLNPDPGAIPADSIADLWTKSR